MFEHRCRAVGAVGSAEVAGGCLCSEWEFVDAFGEHVDRAAVIGVGAAAAFEHAADEQGAAVAGGAFVTLPIC